MILCFFKELFYLSPDWMAPWRKEFYLLLWYIFNTYFWMNEENWILVLGRIHSNTCQHFRATHNTTLAILVLLLIKHIIVFETEITRGVLFAIEVGKQLFQAKEEWMYYIKKQGWKTYTSEVILCSSELYCKLMLKKIKEKQYHRAFSAWWQKMILCMWKCHKRHKISMLFETTSTEFRRSYAHYYNLIFELVISGLNIYTTYLIL